MNTEECNCPSKIGEDDCMEMPICNEYGDLIGYQSCEAQQLCPYRSQIKIEKLESKIQNLAELVSHQREKLEKIENVLQENCNQCFEIDNFSKPDDCGICEWARILKIIRGEE